MEDFNSFLLNAVAAPTSSVSDTVTDLDDTVMFDIINRTITPNSIDDIVVQADNNSRTISYKIQRMFEDVDLSTKTISIRYTTPNKAYDESFATNIQVFEDYITFDWKIGESATQESGNILYDILFHDAKGYKWHTKPATLEIEAGLRITSILPKPPQDWIDSWRIEAVKLLGECKDASETVAKDKAEVSATAEKVAAEANRAEQILADKVDVKVLNDIIGKPPYDNIVSNYFADKDNGKIVSASHYSVVENILVSQHIQVFVKTNMRDDSAGICFYNKNHEFISGFNASNKNETGLVLDVPKDAYYCNVSCLSSHIGSFLIRYNSISNSIVKNGEDIENIEKYAPVLISNKNIFDDINFTKDKFIRNDGKILDVNPSARYGYSDLFQLVKGNSLSITSSDASGSTIARVSEWNENGVTFLKMINAGTTEETTFSITADHTMYLRLCGQLPAIKSIIFNGYNITEKFYDIVQGISEERNITKYVNASMFETIGVCGDSFSAGATYNWETKAVEDNVHTRWGNMLSRISGCDVSTYAQGGSDTLNWQTRETCLPKLLQDSKKDLYLLCLGINDADHTTLGTIADIKDNYVDNPNTFYGNYGKIITQIMNYAPNSKIIICKTFLPTYTVKKYYDYSSEAIEEIANHFKIPFIDTKNSPFLTGEFYNVRLLLGHPVPVTYSGLAKSMYELIGKCLFDNYVYFRNYL